MKKVLFAIAALATSLTASAQFWIGGSLNLQNQSYWNNDDALTSWGITPSVGYALDDALEVGLDFGIQGRSQGKADVLQLDIAPFARYTFFSDGDFSMFLQGNIAYEYNKTKVVAESKSWRFGVSIQPGIKYALTDQFSLVAKLGGLYFNHYDPDSPSTANQNGFGLTFSTGVSFGLVYSF